MTTNFDDLTLAAFWELPNTNAWIEPHIIYDVTSSSGQRPRVAPGVPVVVKAHGHHTTYGLGIIDKDIRALAPHVKATLRHLPELERGFVVVGYSAQMDDGVIETMLDPAMTKGKTIYWCTREARPPLSTFMNQIARRATVKIVPIGDSDMLFLRLWQEAHSEPVYYNPPLLEDVVPESIRAACAANTGSERHGARDR